MPALCQTWGNGSGPWWVRADLPSAGRSQPALLQATYYVHPLLEGKARPEDAKQLGLHTDSAFTLPIESPANWALHAFILSPAKSWSPGSLLSCLPVMPAACRVLLGLLLATGDISACASGLLPP